MHVGNVCTTSVQMPLRMLNWPMDAIGQAPSFGRALLGRLSAARFSACFCPSVATRRTDGGVSTEARLRRCTVRGRHCGAIARAAHTPPHTAPAGLCLGYQQQRFEWYIVWARIWRKLNRRRQAWPTQEEAGGGAPRSWKIRSALRRLVIGEPARITARKPGLAIAVARVATDHKKTSARLGAPVHGAQWSCQQACSLLRSASVRTAHSCVL